MELLSKHPERSVVKGCALRLRSTQGASVEVSMIELPIPGRGSIELDYAVFDVNGTLAVDR
jgi:hypothetical protein